MGPMLQHGDLDGSYGATEIWMGPTVPNGDLVGSYGATWRFGWALWCHRYLDGSYGSTWRFGWVLWYHMEIMMATMVPHRDFDRLLWCHTEIMIGPMVSDGDYYGKHRNYNVALLEIPQILHEQNTDIRIDDHSFLNVNIGF